MHVHEEVLQAANRLCRKRRGWRFRPAEVVAALPGLNRGTVRTHVMSRCCTNAPVHHVHRWPYFRRVARGVYEIRPGYRKTAPPARRRVAPSSKGAREIEVRETGGGYHARAPDGVREEQATTLDALVERLRETEGAAPYRLCLTLLAAPTNPIVDAYAREVDRTQIRRNLRLTAEERLVELQQWISATDEIRGAATNPRRRLT